MLHVVLRTCDGHSLQSTRIVDKSECILRCLNSIIDNLKNVPEKKLHIIDDASSDEFRVLLKNLVQGLNYVTIQLLEKRENNHLSIKKRSRYSVKIAYEYINTIPDDDLVYIVEDDYLHFPGSILQMLDDWNYLTTITEKSVGIFPQDFNQLYYNPEFQYNETYVRPCLVVPTKNRYYRTTWYTHESFLIQSKNFKKYKKIFEELLTIGDNEINWEGNTISKIWTNKDFLMFMPLKSLVIHMSNSLDIPYFVTVEQVQELWNLYKTPWSVDKKSSLKLTKENIRKWNV